MTSLLSTTASPRAASADRPLPRALARMLSLDDFEAAAKRRLPRPIFGYVAGAAEDNQSLRGNRNAFAQYAFSPRVLVDVSRRTQQTELFGRRYASPFGIAPMGISALSAYRGDIVLARAAREQGIPAILSGTSLIPLEDVIRAAPGTWFQAYLPGDPQRIDALVERARHAGYETLVLTVDIPVSANRENNVRTGFSTPLKPSLRLAWDGLTRPRWLAGTFMRTLLAHGMPHFENSFATRGAPIVSSSVLRDFSARDHLSWEHVARIRRQWPGTLIIKGILHPQDAALARQHGADGIIVSNHGGRQLDGAVSPLRALPGVVAAAGNMTVMMDSGVRRGSDVLKALALGASFVFVGRPFNYAAAVGGEAGVAHAIGLLRAEVDRNMAMLGINHVREMGPDLLVRENPHAA
ncbi:MULTISPECIES: alpha-hydroxy acid oxidase [Achromobacter]|uniref:Alpha-hydroxy-acid oxidizing protein n=1 Tax=Alcaligenes xylosoxydans xylosoxydans TaxID=85698 RepID=A0A424WF35_ALCXX|nr:MULTISPECIES: alpha-hydroxy acid oxidase [Achromobacter]MBC9902631.1 alpha-hydroxy-acid oxidizing protein [Achromobacter xylosoxidans]MBD0868394.1 alpha-hydroxy-acid oxidizing protein [Achromobacter xylosoxidans]MDH1302885.1 alpha-hydroxy-acid oxidizing protein [Achromobacter sp. GD03932]QNP83075.1 alpha-hydroxy-acid oxidizing protein [Achromobacter xylosoxidans]RPJ91862.1 alpha-hydroxy-acid oxidizing protein [Achromobacter xylosoxidans]